MGLLAVLRRGLIFTGSLKGPFAMPKQSLTLVLVVQGHLCLAPRMLFAIPQDTLLDDVIIPMQAVTGGRRVLFDAEARAYDPQRLDVKREKYRKARTLAGNFQMLFRYSEWLLPWKFRLWWKLASHKYSRLFTPVSTCYYSGWKLDLKGCPFLLFCSLSRSHIFVGHLWYTFRNLRSHPYSLCQQVSCSSLG